jgi:hypothetical protein
MTDSDKKDKHPYFGRDMIWRPQTFGWLSKGTRGIQDTGKIQEVFNWCYCYFTIDDGKTDCHRTKMVKCAKKNLHLTICVFSIQDQVFSRDMSQWLIIPILFWDHCLGYNWLPNVSTAGFTPVFRWLVVITLSGFHSFVF